jgi:hypothetical protein
MAGRAAALVLVGSLLVTACSGGGGSSDSDAGGPVATTATPTARPHARGGVLGTATLDCTAYIGTTAPPRAMRVVAGVVALPASPRLAALGTSRTGSVHRAVRLYAKWGLTIRAGESFTLSVPRRLVGIAAIGWGPSARPAVSVTVPACRAGRVRWLSFAGGYFVRHILCLPLLVRAHGGSETAHIGVGVACPGQKPPQGPTQQ